MYFAASLCRAPPSRPAQAYPGGINAAPPATQCTVLLQGAFLYQPRYVADTDTETDTDTDSDSDTIFEAGFED